MTKTREERIQEFMADVLDPETIAESLLIDIGDEGFWDLFCEDCPVRDEDGGCSRYIGTDFYQCERKETWDEIVSAIRVMKDTISCALWDISGKSTKGA